MKPFPTSRHLISTMVVLAGVILFTPATHAVNLGVDNRGQALIFPYYTTRGGNDTLIAITNSLNRIGSYLSADEDITNSLLTRALKVRLLEGEYGRVVLSFNLYMSGNSMWTAILSEQNGVPTLSTSDESCTIPHIDQTPLDLDNITDQPDSGRNTIDRLREGYIEVIEMGRYSVYDFASTPVGPNGCEAIAAAWDPQNDGLWANDPQSVMLPPAGFITGSAVVIDVANARAAAYNAVALQNFYQPDGINDPPSLHTAPDNPEPSLNAAYPPISQIYLRSQNQAELVSDEWPNGNLAVSAVLMSDALTQTYAIESVIGGQTEWVVTAPTLNALTDITDGPAPPFSTTFDEPQPGQGDGRACHSIGIDLYDRETRKPPPPGPIGVPPPSNSDLLCFAVNTYLFKGAGADSVGNHGLFPDPRGHELDGTQSPLLGSRLFYNFNTDVTPGFEAGWFALRFSGLSFDGRFDFGHALANPISNRVYSGLPVVGVSFQAATNRSINALFGASAPLSPRYRILEPGN
ncbi:MAG: hypothetical protein Tsb002_09550 [Wenzhouxiangellaceae bacterium]